MILGRKIDTSTLGILKAIAILPIITGNYKYSGKAHKHSTFVNYNASAVLTEKLSRYSSTLESPFTIVEHSCD